MELYSRYKLRFGTWSSAFAAPGIVKVLKRVMRACAESCNRRR